MTEFLVDLDTVRDMPKKFLKCIKTACIYIKRLQFD